MTTADEARALALSMRGLAEQALLQGAPRTCVGALSKAAYELGKWASALEQTKSSNVLPFRRVNK